MEKKKILFYVSGIGLGGVEKVILEVLKGIDKEKYDIKLGLNNENENFFENEIPKEINYQYMVNRKIIEKTLMYKKRKNILNKLLYSYMLWYEKYIAKKNFLKFAEDREILIDFKSGDYLRLINLFKDKKKIVWLHGEIINLTKYKKNKKKFIDNLKQCNKIILVCNEMKNEFIENIKGLEEKLKVIYNPFNIKKILKMASDYSEENIESKKLLKENYILMVSRFDLKAKDFFSLFNAVKLLENLNFKLFLLGNGIEEKKILEKEIKNLKLENKIIILEERKNPYPWIKNAKILVHSSKTEGFGLVLVEAQILETLVIATKCKIGPEEILNKGKSGILVEVGDYKEMAKQIKKILENEYLKEEYLIEMKKSILRFESQNIINEIEKTIDAL